MFFLIHSYSFHLHLILTFLVHKIFLDLLILGFLFYLLYIEYILEKFLIDTSEYDLIVGYRADDSYFSFAQDFVSGAISLRKLSEAMRLGKLGEQVVLKSEKSFSHIRFIDAEPAAAETYFEKKSVRDRDARRAYRLSRQKEENIHELYMLDIMREEIKNGDPRLR